MPHLPIAPPSINSVLDIAIWPILANGSAILQEVFTMAVMKVWIEEGCIVCNACETASPEVFLVTEDTCVIRAEVREDGQENENLEDQSGLKDEIGEELEDAIEEAAEGCPVEVIKFTTD